MQHRALLIASHIIGCIGFLYLPVLFAPGPPSFQVFNEPRTLEEFFSYVFMLIFFYVNYFVLIPKLYFTRKHASYIFSLLFCMVIIIMVPRLIFHPHIMHGPPPPFDIGSGPDPHFMRPPPLFNLYEISHHFFLFLVIVFISLMIKIQNQWKLATREKLATELSYLRAQVNPHFLFNSLNSIYSLSLIKSDDTPAAILKLSGMMRYILTEAQEEYVLLSKEIDYVSNYIELQKIRLGNTVTTDYTITGDAGNEKIAPLLLIPLVENAYKHGVNPEQESTITIGIDIKPHQLNLLVANRKVTYSGLVESTGVGMFNLRQRLQLLYPSHHSLTINEDENNYSAHLIIQF